MMALRSLSTKALVPSEKLVQEKAGMCLNLPSSMKSFFAESELKYKGPTRQHAQGNHKRTFEPTLLLILGLTNGHDQFVKL